MATKVVTPDLESELAAAKAEGIRSRRGAAKAKDECVVATTIKSHEKGRTVASVVADLEFSADRIAEVLARRDIFLSSSAIRRHRATTCPCYVNPDGTRK